MKNLRPNMKRKLLRITLASSLIITSLLFGGVAYAQDEELPAPGITPDSPFYFFDTLSKNISMFFTFGPEAKAGKALQYAEERLSEAQAMAEKNRVKEMEKAANGYDKFMAMVTEKLDEAEPQGISGNISERVALATAKHLAILDGVKDKVPEKARDAILKARDASMNGQVTALQALGKNKPERALDISSDTIEKLMERARFSVSGNSSADNVTGDVEEELDYADRIEKLEDELAAIAEEKGIDINAIQQHLAQSTTNRLDVLSGVYEKAPESAHPAIENAIENSVRKYERAVEKLKEKNAPDNITANVTALQKLPEPLKEKLNIRTTNKAQIASNTPDNITVQIKVQTENKEQIGERLTNTGNGNHLIVSVNETEEQRNIRQSSN
jgi:arginine utilization protein RocB